MSERRTVTAHGIFNNNSDDINLGDVNGFISEGEIDLSFIKLKSNNYKMIYDITSVTVSK